VSDYVTLSRRESGEERVLHPGVPEHLVDPLVEWIKDYADHRVLREAALTAEVAYAPTNPDYERHRTPALIRGINAAPDTAKAFLNVVDAILFIRTHDPESAGWEVHREQAKIVAAECAKSLDKILRLGGSKWHVVGDHLEARLHNNVREAVEQAREQAKGSASKHLGEALRACFGRTPNPGRAYSEAFKAAEAAAKPVISPKDSVTTLGRMNGELKANPGLWRFAIAPGDVQPVISAMSTLIDGQTDRHGGGSVPITQEAAESALLLAATLVHWFATGAVARR
jgi:hypothetical protein